MRNLVLASVFALSLAACSSGGGSSSGGSSSGGGSGAVSGINTPGSVAVVQSQ